MYFPADWHFTSYCSFSLHILPFFLHSSISHKRYISIPFMWLFLWALTNANKNHPIYLLLCASINIQKPTFSSHALINVSLKWNLLLLVEFSYVLYLFPYSVWKWYYLDKSFIETNKYKYINFKMRLQIFGVCLNFLASQGILS